MQYITQHRIIGEEPGGEDSVAAHDLGHFYPPTPADRQRVRDKI